MDCWSWNKSATLWEWKNDRWLLALPLDRVGGLGHSGAIAAEKVYGCPPRTLAPADVAEAIRQHAVTLVSVVPTQLQGLLNEGPHLLDALRGLKTVFVGGAPMPEILQQKLLNEGISFHRSWGMTEAASTVCIAVKDSSARPLPGLLVEESPFGLIVGGPQIGGFHCTGDVGHVDSDGNVLIEGRIDDVLISGGVNVSANRIATELTEHPDVSDAVVLGIPDERWGQRVVAVVQSLELESMPCASVLKKWARARLKREECPKDIFVVSRDLRDQMGKVRADEWSSWLQQAGKGGE